jgi:hypothetical protein
LVEEALVKFRVEDGAEVILKDFICFLL